MSETNKESVFSKPLPFLQNAASFESINPPGCSPPPKVVPSPPQPSYPNYPSYSQLPHSSHSIPYEQPYQIHQNPGYNFQGYNYPQHSSFAGYDYLDYGSHNNTQDVQYTGHLPQNVGPNPPVPYIDYLTTPSVFPYPQMLTDITKPPPILHNAYSPSHQASTSVSNDANYVYSNKSGLKGDDKNYHDKKDKYKNFESNEDSVSTHRKHNYSRSEYSSARDGRAKSSSSYYDDQSKRRSHKSHDDYAKHRTDRLYKDSFDKNRDVHTKNNQSSHRSYNEKSARSRSREKTTRRDSKYRRSTKSSRSPERRSQNRYRSCSVTKSKRTVDDIASEKNKPDEDHYENRSQISNSIEKACENIRSSDEEKSDDEDEPLLKRWYRSSPAELYYVAVDGKSGVVESTPRARKVTDAVREKLIDRGKKSRPSPGTEPIIPPRAHRPKLCKHKSEHVSSSDSSSGSENDEADHAMQELERKQQHPRRLHPEMWYNDPGEMNDGPLCRCSARTRRQGIRHGVYAAEMQPPPCDIYTNNADKLYHYRITISPPTNFLIKTLTVITHDEHEFLFSGFSLLSHYPLTKLPTCKVIRFNIEYTILYIEEQAPVNYTIEELELFEEFLFREILELVDLDMGQRTEDGCSQFHLLPRWERALGGGGGEVLAMVEVLKHLIRSGGLLLPPSSLKTLRAASQREWQSFVDGVRGMIVTYPGKKPCSVRVDQLDRSLADDNIKSNKEETNNDQNKSDLVYPEIVHFGIRPPQLSYAGNPEYKKAWRDYVKFRHLVANMAKPSYEDKRKLESKEARLQEMRTQTKMKRDVTVALSAEGFYRTGIMCDVVQHAMLIPVLISHLRFHNSLNTLEKTVNYKFENRSLLQLALTHPSYRDNFGTNPDHARNSLTNCGIRQPEYGDRRIHYMNIRKRGINTLINIMSRFGKKQETESAISHNERLEFLGDAVVEFISSIHLFKMFPSLEEGGLATYRAAIVQNQHLAQLAKKLGLEQYMLYAHGSDLCHDLELRHAMANCFEALMGALFLDGGIDVADRVFAIALWKDKPELLEAWRKPRLHPLQEQEPYGDRRWLDQYPFLQNLTKFEDSIGIKFKHIRLLARAFTDRSMGFTNLTLGSNQRLEFLGDTVLQLISSEHLYKHFPEHHEGHLSLLRSSLVNNRTQAVVCDDLAMSSYAVYHNPKAEPKTKDKADLLEAFLGALYIDKNIEYCHAFCSVCLFPRLREFIMNQEWNDPKSKLQQCCLTLRTMDGAEPDIPIYKVIECVGPTNTREYTVAVYFRGERLASARGHCIQEAEMNAAKQALTNSHNLFPQLDRQKRVIAKSMKRQRNNTRRGKYSKLDYDHDKERNENHNSYSKEGGTYSRERRISSDRSPCNNDSKQKRQKLCLDKFPSSKDKDKLPLAYRPDRFDNKNDDDSDSISTNLNKSLIELSDMDSDIVYSDNSLDKNSVIDSDT